MATTLAGVADNPHYDQVSILPVDVDSLAKDALSLEAALLVGTERSLVPLDYEQLNPVKVPIAEGKLKKQFDGLGPVTSSPVLRVANTDLQFCASVYRAPVDQLAGSYEAPIPVSDREDHSVRAILHRPEPIPVMKTRHRLVGAVEEDQLAVIDPSEKGFGVLVHHGSKYDANFVRHG